MQLNAQATKVTQDYIKFSNDRVKGGNQQNGKAAHRTEYIFQMIIQWGINNYKEFCKLEKENPTLKFLQKLFKPSRRICLPYLQNPRVGIQPISDQKYVGKNLCLYSTFTDIFLFIIHSVINY